MLNWRIWVDRRGLRGDLFGGVTAAIVSLPLALAFGVASGAGPEAGLYGAVLVGFWAALFGGTRTLISEPTGPMTLMMATVMTRLAATHPEEAWALGFAVVVLAGIFQMLFGFLKLGRYVTLMPYSVISGFMSGIGVTLVLLQVAPLLGHVTPAGGAAAVLMALPEMLREVRPIEAALGLSSLAVLFLQPVAWRRFVPPQLVVLLLGTLLAWFFLADSDLRLIGSLPGGLPSLRLPIVSPNLIGVVLVDALLLAMLGCVDTLLTAMVADSLTRSQHDSNRELMGQGIANIVSGLFGGLPGAGATMGTVVNIQSGATTPRSGMIRALTLLVAILLAAPLLENVPMAVLAAITFKVGVDILDWSFLRRAHRVSYAATFIMYGVLILTVLVDLMVAVGIGVFIANVITIERLARVQSNYVRIVDPASDLSLPMRDVEKELFDQAQGKVVIFHLSGPMIFGVAKAIAREHRVSQGARILIVDLGDVPLLSTTIALAIENVILDTQAEGLRVIVAGANGKVLSRLEGLGVVGKGASTISAATREEALRCALSLLRKDAAVN